MENKHIQQVDFSNPNADKITSGTTHKSLEKKQTAVEWLVEWSKNNPVAFQSDYYAVIEQAKEMERDQLDKAYRDGLEYGCKCN